QFDARHGATFDGGRNRWQRVFAHETTVKGGTGMPIIGRETSAKARGHPFPRTIFGWPRSRRSRSPSMADHRLTASHQPRAKPCWYGEMSSVSRNRSAVA